MDCATLSLKLLQCCSFLLCFCPRFVETERKIGELQIAIVRTRERIVNHGLCSVDPVFSKKVFVDPQTQGMIFAKLLNSALWPWSALLYVAIGQISALFRQDRSCAAKS
jgi:hypothetical protein